jgi:5'-nucleotidase
LKKPVKQLNIDQKEVLINQVGWAGINIGRIDYHFSQNDSLKKVFGRSIFIKNNSKNT